MVLFDFFRIAHIIAGFTALVIFWITVIVKKGGPLHKRIGWLYVYSMAIVAISAFYMGFFRIFIDKSSDTGVISFSWFLVYIAVLSSATVWYGLRVLRYKRRTTRNVRLDVLGFPVLLFLSSIGISVYGFIINMSLLSYFPLVGLFLSGSQLIYWLRKPAIKGHWYIEHLIGMLSCSISTITAFLVFGAPRLLNIDSVSVILWFTPTILLTPVIIGFSVYYGNKFNKVRV
ncbi:DUF2306 domain-containing protein [Gracilibacillus oryzae]|uniref:DUF2306 domain-containing protein n=1 Tax=Gracilibacillus oryzae TaxID=1672701 RepID=A0A7C8L203_9BACI|nr:DUF2306 domain-containing protein [Gracilibacillus oryzae]KAB8139353.1 DUF2306 domain-containing protein [Gracilibacillus oryzae]